MTKQYLVPVKKSKKETKKRNKIPAVIRVSNIVKKAKIGTNSRPNQIDYLNLALYL